MRNNMEYSKPRTKEKENKENKAHRPEKLHTHLSRKNRQRPQKQIAKLTEQRQEPPDIRTLTQT